MGNKQAVIQAKKALADILALTEEKTQRESWRAFLESATMDINAIISSFDTVLIKYFLKHNYRLYIIMLSEVRVWRNTH